MSTNLFFKILNLDLYFQEFMYIILDKIPENPLYFSLLIILTRDLLSPRNYGRITNSKLLLDNI